MNLSIRCKLCDAQASISDQTPQQAGWTQITIAAPAVGIKYLVACPAHTPNDIVAAVKAAFKGKT